MHTFIKIFFVHKWQPFTILSLLVDSILILLMILLEMMRYEARWSELDSTEKLLLHCTGWGKGHLMLFYTQSCVLPDVEQSLNSTKPNRVFQDFSFTSCSEAEGSPLNAAAILQRQWRAAWSLKVGLCRALLLHRTWCHGNNSTEKCAGVLWCSVLFDSKF